MLAEQLAYYRAGAAEYDRQYAEYEDLRELLTVVDELPIAGDVLEPACGTGQWTPRLAARAFGDGRRRGSRGAGPRPRAYRLPHRPVP